jgi:hypothetical protein
MSKKSGSRRRWVMTLALVVLVGAASLAVAIASGSGVASADPGGETGHDFNVTFTKWVPNPPAMVGIVGGDVGEGTFEGQILEITGDAVHTNIHALYGFHGSLHSLTADNHVVITNATGVAEINGTVIDGWQKGKTVTGYFNTISCPQGACFQGALQIHAGK